MAKYILYVNVKDVESAQVSQYTETVRKELVDNLLNDGDKLAVLLVYQGVSRIETLP